MRTPRPRIALQGGLALVALTLGAPQARADLYPPGSTTITDGDHTVGFGPDGELYDDTGVTPYKWYGDQPGIGFQDNTQGTDALSVGLPRDSWGVYGLVSTKDGTPAGTFLGIGDQSYKPGWNPSTIYGTQNVATTFTGGGASSSAVFTSKVDVGTAPTAIANTAPLHSSLTVTQSYQLTKNILFIKETITNTSAYYTNELLFGRDVDWDFPWAGSGHQNSFGPIGASPLVTDSSYWGVEQSPVSIPGVASYTSSCFVSCNAWGDLGGGITVDLPNLAPGQSDTVEYYYGMSYWGDTVDTLISQAKTAGAQYIIATQTPPHGGYFYPGLGLASAFIGVSSDQAQPGPIPNPGPTPVPEPAGAALLGLGGVALALRRRR